MSARIPYVCTGCGAEGCKLFRQHQTFADNIRLFCVFCAQLDQRVMYDAKERHSVGWLVAAVPTDDGETFWGYTSVPQSGCDWWDALPLIVPLKPAAPKAQP